MSEDVSLPRSGCNGVNGTAAYEGRNYDVIANLPEINVSVQTTPSSTILPESSAQDEKKDDDSYVTTVVTFTFLLGAGKWLAQKVGSWILSKGASHLFTNYILPYRLTIVDKKIRAEIEDPKNGIDNFTKAVDHLVRKLQYDPQDAFKSVVKYTLTRKGVKITDTYVNTDVLQRYFNLTIEDVRMIRRSYGFTFESMAFMIDIVAKEVKNERAGFDMIKTIRDAIPKHGTGEISSKTLDHSLTETQERRRRLAAKIETRYAELLTNSLKKVIAEMEGGAPGKEKFSLRVNSREVIIDLTVVSPEDRKAYLDDCCSRLKDIYHLVSSRKRFIESDLEPIKKLANDVPGAITINNLEGTTMGTLLRAQDNVIELLTIALDETDPRSKAANRFLNEVNASKNGIMAYQIGGEPVRVFMWGHSFTPEDTPEVHETKSSRVGPYTFYESKLVRFNGDGSSVSETAMIYVDRRGRPGVVTLSQMKKILSLAESIRRLANSNPENADVQRRAKSFFFFLNDLQAAWQSIKWSDADAKLALTEGTPESVSERAALIGKLHPGYELMRTLRQIRREMLDRKHFNPMPEEKYREMTEGVVEYLRRVYSPFFATAGLGTEFEKKLGFFKKAILEGNEQEILEIHQRIKKLIFKAMGQTSGSKTARLDGNVRTLSFGEEVLEWMKVAEKGLERTTDVELDRVSAVRVNQDKKPSLQTAMEFFVRGKYMEALNEYGRMLITPDVPVEERITAAKELFRAAQLSRDPTRLAWMEKSLSEMSYLVSSSEYVLTTNDRKFIEEVVEHEKDGGVRVPPTLKKAIESTYGIKAATKLVNTLLTGEEVLPFKVDGRFDLLSDAARTEIGRLIDGKTALGLYKYSHNELRKVATLTTAELEQYLAVEQVGAKDAENFRRFHTSASAVIKQHQYDALRLSKHPAVKHIAAQGLGSYDVKSTAVSADGVYHIQMEPTRYSELPIDTTSFMPAWVTGITKLYNAVMPKIQPAIPILRGGLIFWIGSVGSKLVLEKWEQLAHSLHPKNAAKEYALLTAGGELGRITVREFFKIKRVSTAHPFAKRFLGRGVPLFTALMALEFGETGSIDTKRILKGALNVTAATSATTAVMMAVKNSSWLTKIAMSAKLFNRVTGKLSFQGLALSAVAEFTIITLLDDIERQATESAQIDAFRKSLIAVLQLDQEMIGKIAAGEDVPLRDILYVETGLSAHIGAIKHMFDAASANINLKYVEKKREIDEWYRREYVKPLDGTRSRAELGEHYKRRLAILEKEQKKELELLKPPKEIAFARLPADLTKPHPHSHLFVVDESVSPLDIDGSVFPTEAEVGYERLLARDFHTLSEQIEQYIKDRNTTLLAMWEKEMNNAVVSIPENRYQHVL